MRILIIVVLIASEYLTASDGLDCTVNTKKRILNHHKHQSGTSGFLVQSDVANVEDMLKGSRKTLKLTQSFSFTLQANGTRKTEYKEIQKGFWPKLFCFTSRCVGMVTRDIIGRTPDPRSQLNSDGRGHWIHWWEVAALSKEV